MQQKHIVHFIEHYSAHFSVQGHYLVRLHSEATVEQYPNVHYKKDTT